jgi:hypothetical protein
VKFSFQIIGAGLSRTGTLASRLALSQLLKGNIYHGFISSTTEDQPDFWLQAAEGKVGENTKQLSTYVGN